MTVSDFQTFAVRRVRLNQKTGELSVQIPRRFMEEVGWDGTIKTMKVYVEDGAVKLELLGI